MKQLLSSLLLLLACLTTSAEELTYTYEGQTLTYTIDQEALTCEVKAGTINWDTGLITAGNDVSGDLVIPEAIKNGRFSYTVTSIGEGAFGGCTGLTSVVIPNTVKKIGQLAFAFCALTTVDIPYEVWEIEPYTFYSCTSLVSINMPDFVETIGDFAFYGCTSLPSVNLPAFVRSIDYGAFHYMALPKALKDQNCMWRQQLGTQPGLASLEM